MAVCMRRCVVSLRDHYLLVRNWRFDRTVLLTSDKIYYVNFGVYVEFFELQTDLLFDRLLPSQACTLGLTSVNPQEERFLSLVEMNERGILAVYFDLVRKAVGSYSDRGNQK